MNYESIPTQVYRPEDGDILVFKFKKTLSYERVRKLRHEVQEYLGGKQRILVLDGGTELEVVRRPDLNGQDLERWESEGGR